MLDFILSRISATFLFFIETLESLKPTSLDLLVIEHHWVLKQRYQQQPSLFDAFLAGLLLVCHWPRFGYLLAGVVSGILIGVIPGLGGGIGIVLLLPFTFGLDSVSAFALLLGMYAVTMTGDTVTSVMLGIPGTAASQATILDGYPLEKKGEAQREFGPAYIFNVE